MLRHTGTSAHSRRVGQPKKPGTKKSVQDLFFDYLRDVSMRSDAVCYAGSRQTCASTERVLNSLRLLHATAYAAVSKPSKVPRC
jgi:hypothetical protein